MKDPNKESCLFQQKEFATWVLILYAKKATNGWEWTVNRALGGSTYPG